MEQPSYESHTRHLSDQQIDLPSVGEQELAHDSRYLRINGHLDVMIAMLRHYPGCSLTFELARLLQVTLDHAALEKRLMKQIVFSKTIKHHLHHLFICIRTDELCWRFCKGQEVLLHELAYIRLLWIEHVYVSITAGITAEVLDHGFAMGGISHVAA